ncbi:MAG: CHASE3 domain-containing protein [Betaproteobacteria bacterium]|nr:CHASE3 domain-containing protein [Betaproteobacteria bacterium]
MPISKYGVKLALILAVVLLTIALLGVQLIFQNIRFLQAHRQVTHTLDVQVTADELLETATEGTNALRGYIITGKESFLANYVHMRENLLLQYENLATLVADNPVQQRNLPELKAQLQLLLKETQEQLNLFKQADTDRMRLRLMHSSNLALNDRIELAIQGVNDEERRLLTAREERLSWEANKLFMLDGIVISAMFAMIFWMAWSMSQELKLRESHFLERRALIAELKSRNIELEAANEALVRADQYKSEFLSAMSHELRTPLNSIIGFSNVIRKGMAGPLNDIQARQIGLVEDSALHLLRLINDLLDLSRIEAGKATLHVETFDLCALVEETLATVKPLADKKSLALQKDCGLTPLFIQADRVKVYQILLNLLSNAIKFSEKGHVSVHGTLHGNHFQITVSDEGMGIPADEIPFLFQAFHQVDGSHKKMHEGTGLGLYLCKKLVELMGGTIRVESAEGKGSRFSFTLPLKQNEAAA